MIVEEGLEVLRTAGHDAALADELYRDQAFRAGLRNDAEATLRTAGLRSLRSGAQTPRSVPAAWTFRRRLGGRAA
ncbi:MAG: hypothetical protein ACRDGE_00590 [Candidatus Limnocylindria bacterium]